MTIEQPQIEKSKTSVNFRNILIFVVLGVSIWGFLGFPGLPKGEHNITMGRGTAVVTSSFLGQKTTISQIITSEGLAGKYPVDRQLIITYPLATNGLQSVKITSFTMTTPGFKFIKAEPSLPVSAPTTGSIIVNIYIEGPTQPYTGPLDYTVYLETVVA